MIRKLMAVAMVATLMCGSAAWAVQVDIAVTPTPPTVPASTAADVVYVTALAASTWTVDNPYTTTALAIDTNAAWYGWDDAGTTLSAFPVNARIDTLTFANTGALLNISSMADVTIGNRVLVDITGAGINLAGGLDASGDLSGTVDFAAGADINVAGGLISSGGIIYSGAEAGEEIVLGADGAFVVNTVANTTLLKVDASRADFVVNAPATASAITWNVAAGTGVGDLEVNMLDIQEGMVELGLANTAFTANDIVLMGDNVDDYSNPTQYTDATLRLSNAGGEINWTGGTYTDANGNVQKAALYMGAGSNVYTVDPGATGAGVVVNVGTAGVSESGNIVLNGSDEIFNGNPFSAISGYTNLDAEGVNLFFVDAAGDSKLILNGTFNVITGTIDTAAATPVGVGRNTADRMDMVVNLQASQGGLVNTLFDGGYNTQIKYLSLGAVGDKFRGISIIGNPTDTTSKAEVMVQNYTQTSGTLLGTGGLGNRVTPPALFGTSYISIYGTTNVSGGIMAIDTYAGGDMTFNGTSFNANDTAILAGIGQFVRNETFWMSDDGTNSLGQYSDVNLYIGENAAIDLSLAGLMINGLNTYVDHQGDVVFGSMIAPALMQPSDMVLTVVSTRGHAVEFVANNSGSIKFSESFLKTDFTDTATYPNWPHVLIDTRNDPLVTLDVADTAFSGLFGAFSTTTDTANGQYVLDSYVAGSVLFDGTADDFADANNQLSSMYGGKTNGGLNQMIYQSVSDYRADPTPQYPYDRLYLVDNATAADADSFNMNMRNLQHFAAGRAEANSVMNLFNGNAMNGVNMISQAVARSHVRSAMNRSDEIRETWNMVKNTVSGGDGLASSIMNANYTNRVWVGGFGLWEDADSRDDLAGYKYKSGGFIVGYDRLIGQNWIVGGSFAYNKGDFEDKAAIAHDSDIDNYSFNLYATYTHCSGFFGTAFAGYTYSDNDINETYFENLNNRVRSNQDNHTNTWIVGGKVGYDWRPNERFYITPSVGFTYINARTSAHTAMLGNTALGKFSKLKDEAYYIPVEINIGYDVYVCNDSKLNLNLNVGYAYNFDEDGVSGNIVLSGIQNAHAYGVQSREQGHHLFNVGAGATFTKGRFDFGVKYDYYRQAKADTHRVLGTVGMKF